jgi:hypothetical protein
MLRNHALRNLLVGVAVLGISAPTWAQTAAEAEAQAINPTDTNEISP